MLLLGTAAAAVAAPVTGLALWGRGLTAPPAAVPTPTAAPPTFTVPEVPQLTGALSQHPAAGALAWADAHGVLPLPSGASPDQHLMRGDLVLALHRFAGTPAVPTESLPVLLADVPQDPERAAATLWLHGQGVLWGDAELRIHPDAPATHTATVQLLGSLLGPALVGAGIEAGPVLEPVHSVILGPDGAAGIDPESAPLTLGQLALALHGVELALAT